MAEFVRVRSHGRIPVPRCYKPYPGVGLAREQDVDGLVEALERTGKRSPFEVDARGFTIFCK